MVHFPPQLTEPACQDIPAPAGANQQNAITRDKTRTQRVGEGLGTVNGGNQVGTKRESLQRTRRPWADGGDSRFPESHIGLQAQ